MAFPTTDLSRWGEGGTEGGPWASFVLRYRTPLAHYARHRFGLPAEWAEELTARFLARQLEGEGAGRLPLFRLYEPGRASFRSLLATAFWRFVRDELEKARRREGVDLSEVPEPACPGDDEVCRLVARELLDLVRERVALDLDEAERAVLALKWPVGLENDPLTNAAVERQLALSRGRVRAIVQRIGAGFLTELRALAEQARVGPADLIPLLHDTCRALDRDA